MSHIHATGSRKRYKNLPQPPVIRRSKTRSRIPTLLSWEPNSTAPRIRSRSNIIESPRISIQHRIDKSQSFLPFLQTLLINASKNRCKQRRRRRRASDEQGLPFTDDSDLVTQSGDVGIPTAGTVVDAAVGVEAGVVDGLVIGVIDRLLHEVA